MLNVQNFVSITDFRQNLSSWINKAKGQNHVVILQNSKPKAILVDPEYLDYLEKYSSGYYDKGDVAELKRATKVQDAISVFNPKDYE